MNKKENKLYIFKKNKNYIINYIIILNYLVRRHFKWMINALNLYSYFEFIYLFSNSIYINIDLESKSRKI